MNKEETIQHPIHKTPGRTRVVTIERGGELSFQNDIKSLLSPLLWDRNTDVEYYLQLMKKDRRTSAEEKELGALYIKILNFNNWHTVVKHFGVKYAVDHMLTENVIRGLFPRPLRKKYEFVRNVLSEAV